MGAAPDLTGTWYFPPPLLPSPHHGTTPAGSTEPYQYLGCYADTLKPPHLLPSQLKKNGDGRQMAVDVCARRASGGGPSTSYTYFGLQSGSKCFAGSDGALAVSLGSSSNCSLVCANDTGVDCGGQHVNSLYEFITGE